ncbi:lipoprotein [Corynebacterium aquilae]|uniref:Lipoprotein n=1 Tax=Corynebacterium aquilae DSM 44791 TaxID=1431546 RepID=A0A1L7CDU3_9CORY|nr:lipoprotein [Corynebacterium aquilae]APT83998.1 hypothetical protein CAQU_01710 [Corynebacterium aquilae DSM 44791]
MRRMALALGCLLVLSGCNDSASTPEQTSEPPHVVACLDAYEGASKFSDGSVGYSDYCKVFGNGPVYSSEDGDGQGDGSVAVNVEPSQH